MLPASGPLSISNSASSVASNVRYEEGVVCNAPGYQRIDLRSSLLTDLVAHWRLDEASGSRKDASLNARDLTAIAGTDDVVGQVSAGKINTGASFLGIEFTAPTITCLSKIDEFSTAVVFPALTVGSTDTAHRVFVYGQDGSSNQILQTVRTTDNVELNSLSFTSAVNATDAVYAASAQRLFIGFLSASFVWNVYDVDGNALTSLDLSGSASGLGFSAYLAYGTETGRVYCVRGDDPNNVTIFVVDPSDNSFSTHSVDLSAFSGGGTFNGGRVLYSPGYLYLDTGGSNFVQVRLSDFTAVAGLALPQGFALGFCYNPNNGKIYFTTFQATTFNPTVIEVNPTGLSTDFEFVLTNTATNLTFDPVQGRIIANSNTGDYAVLDPVSQTVVCEPTIVSPNGMNFVHGVGLDEDLGKLYVPIGVNSKVFIYQ